MIWLILWSILFCTVFYYYCIRPMSYWKKRGIKQSNPVWLFGDNFQAMTRTESFSEMVLRLYNQHPTERYTGIYQMIMPTLYLRDPELIKQITVKDFDHFVDHRPLVPDNGDILWRKNLFALRGQQWKEMRPILSPSFTSSKIKAIFILMSECAKTFTDYFHNQKQDVVELEMKDVFTRFGNDVIASVAFGIKVDSLKDKNNEFYLMGKDATNFSSIDKTLKVFGYFVAPKLYELLKIRLFSAEVTNFFVDLVEQTIKMREEKGIVRPDMISLLMEAKKGIHKHEKTTEIETGFATVEEADFGKGGEIPKKEITNLDIASQAMIFFFGGFDTVTTVMCFIAYELAVNPDIQTRLRNEIEEVDNECDGKLTYEALMKMKYLDMVVSETLRKWPNAVAVDRLCTKSYSIPPVRPGEKALRVEKGDLIWIPIFGLHRDPKYYPQPEKFDPERFSDENKHKINPYAYLPFGVGPRNCIGSRIALLECKTLFYHLLLNFEIVPVKKTQIPLRISKKSFNLLAEGGHWLGLKALKR